MTTTRPPVGSTLVPAAAAFLTCFAIGITLCVLLGIPWSVAVLSGFIVSAIVAVYAAASYRRREMRDGRPR
jgi:membrane protein implicated in regulation of membrane protease activity